MADVAAPTPAPAQTQPVSGTSLRRLLGATEIDLRLFGMLLALIGILVGFHIMSGGTFIRPANMVTLAVQATGIAIMATGMVLIIVSRNIDLSVGSIVGLVAMSIALLQTDWLPALGLGSDSQWMWLIALALGLDGAEPGDHLVALGYGGGEAIAQAIEITAPVPAVGTAAQIPGEAIDLSTYYRWTRGRQAEPH